MQVKPTIDRYRDLDLNFTAHPVTGDVNVRSGNQAVIASVRNLVLSGFYERPFHKELGSGVRQFLFENAMPYTSQYLKNAIEQVLANFEPRVKIKNLQVIVNNDYNRFDVRLEYYIVSQAEPVTVNFFLERVR